MERSAILAGVIGPACLSVRLNGPIIYSGGTEKNMSDESYKKLDVWRQAIALADLVYRVTGRFPMQERAGLGASLRRSAAQVSIGIAEGYTTGSRCPSQEPLAAAAGALREMLVYLTLSRRLGHVSWLTARRLRRRVRHVEDMLEDLLQSCERQGDRGGGRRRGRRKAA